ncbi:MAG: phosphoribosylaminoimidazolesuccinocarboxamide synthase [Defluviitaleaceae bacterium]|nr:phosphoribosylaminoimidazolesuccinocarboxamide synthase [Defluviitaleaceae bacterium]
MKKELLYEGKAKQIYQTDVDDALLIAYKDSVTAFNGLKKDEISGKARLNNEISCLIFEKLQAAGIKSHFIKRISETEQLVKSVQIIPLEVVVHNMIAGSLAKRLGLTEGTALTTPFVDFFYKDDALDDPLVTDDHIQLLGVATENQVADLKKKALEVNTVLQQLFLEIGIRLVDFKLEFGIDKHGDLLLADEISPDTCRLWDLTTDAKLDKDVYRRGTGDILDVYEQVLSRLS